MEVEEGVGNIVHAARLVRDRVLRLRGSKVGELRALSSWHAEHLRAMVFTLPWEREHALRLLLADDPCHPRLQVRAKQVVCIAAIQRDCEQREGRMPAQVLRVRRLDLMMTIPGEPRGRQTARGEHRVMAPQDATQIGQ